MNNLNAIISSLIPVAAASGATSYFTSVQNKVVSFLNSCLPFVWIIVALALIGVGLMCIIGSERSKEAAKSKAVYVVTRCNVSCQGCCRFTYDGQLHSQLNQENTY